MELKGQLKLRKTVVPVFCKRKTNLGPFTNPTKTGTRMTQVHHFLPFQLFLFAFCEKIMNLTSGLKPFEGLRQTWPRFGSRMRILVLNL